MGWLRHLLCCVLAAAWAVTVSASQRPPVKLDRKSSLSSSRAGVAFIEGVLADEFVAT